MSIDLEAIRRRARTDVPGLLDEVERLCGELAAVGVEAERLREALGRIADGRCDLLADPAAYRRQLARDVLPQFDSEEQR